ncbi:hypothetical protein [Steroidobacter denitrificans]|nr:hypothetical protein [Steroidobacter denitrificans]
MQKAENDRAWCGFVAQVRLANTTAGERPIRDLKQARKAGLLTIPSLEAAIDLMEGTATSAMHRMHQNPKLKNYGDQITVVVLRGLGAPEERIAELMKRPLPAFRRPTKTIE